MINNIWFKIIAWKINKIPEFYTIFAHKMPDYIITQRDRGQAEAKTSRPRPVLRGRGQSFEAEAKILASRPMDLTSLLLFVIWVIDWWGLAGWSQEHMILLLEVDRNRK